MSYLSYTWPELPGNVKSCITTRSGGVSEGGWAAFNLAAHVGDDPAAVAKNRAMLKAEVRLPEAPCWLEQVHGTGVVELTDRLHPAVPPVADAAISRCPGKICAVLTADCLPVLFCHRQGTVVAAAHAGWRGLAAGVLGKTFAAMDIPSEDTLVYLGPAIGARRFEVGEEVRQAFLSSAGNADYRRQAEGCFDPSGEPGKWLADLYGLARAQLNSLGIFGIAGGEHCTFSEASQFYSYRRDGVTGRMASLIWIDH